MEGHESETSWSSVPPTGFSLTERLADMALPLGEAFAARLRALSGGPDLPVPPDVLMTNLLRCVALGDDVDAIVKLAGDVARDHGHAREIFDEYLNGAQALDWAIRDLQLEQYTRLERERFATGTALFVQLVRRATAEKPATPNHAHQTKAP